MSDGTRRDTGFTRVEWMIVITILGLLAIVAAPPFISLTRRAQEREAEVGPGGRYLSLPVAKVPAYHRDATTIVALRRSKAAGM